MRLRGSNGITVQQGMDVTLTQGQKVISVGMLPQAAAYKTYLMEAKVAAELRGDVPQVLVQGGGLAGMGSPRARMSLTTSRMASCAIASASPSSAP